MTQASTAWSWRHAFAQSDLPATTKHVLHTLGMFMNELGEGCYPSVADICRYSGLDKKTVLKHLATARDAGWIDVSQHGYRGQKWKRQEYAARWPERDLVAACPPVDSDEGGGAVPPPSGGAKVVESVPEGGGIEGSKVVEQLHQDKTSPVTTPDTSPTGGAQEREREGEIEDRKKIKAEGWALLKDWPGFAGMPKEPAFREWLKLDADSRAKAKARFADWLALLKAQGKSHVPAPSTYLRERLFDDVPEPAPVPFNEYAPPFGPVWGGWVWGHLVTSPDEAAKGWPLVVGLFRRAMMRQGAKFAERLHGRASLMEGVPVGSVTFEAWRAEHERRGWPWIPDPGEQPAVWFPKGGPGGLDAFEAAITDEAQGDDGGNRQAAE